MFSTLCLLIFLKYGPTQFSFWSISSQGVTSKWKFTGYSQIKHFRILTIFASSPGSFHSSLVGMHLCLASSTENAIDAESCWHDVLYLLVSSNISNGHKSMWWWRWKDRNRAKNCEKLQIKFLQERRILQSNFYENEEFYGQIFTIKKNASYGVRNRDLQIR